MSTLNIRQKLVDIARLDVGQREASRNRGEYIKKYWPATNYPDGYINREPYCAAAMCYWLREWLKLPEVLSALDMSRSEAENWRCKLPAAFGWTRWAKEKGLLVATDREDFVLHTADLMVFDISHIGLVTNDNDNSVNTIEANTGATGGRDGDGVFAKVRRRSEAKNFIRLLA
jgi:hypothetical protein